MTKQNFPELPEAAAHMYPSDLEKFKRTESYATAFSVAVGNPDERSVPLINLSECLEYAEALSAFNMAALSQRGEAVRYEYRWLNPLGGRASGADLAWKLVEPRSIETIEQRCDELRAYMHNDKPCYEVRGLFTAPQPAQPAKPVPMTPGQIDAHIGPDEGDREAVVEIVRQVESFHHIKEQPCAQSNREELLAEDIECLHRCLDDKGVPRSLNGDPLSMWGRVCFVFDAAPQPAQPDVLSLLLSDEVLEAATLAHEQSSCHDLIGPMSDALKAAAERVRAMVPARPAKPVPMTTREAEDLIGKYVSEGGHPMKLLRATEAFHHIKEQP